jgi:hypothetical protein
VVLTYLPFLSSLLQSHRMCDECGRHHLVNSMMENKYPLKCPVVECKRPLLADDMVRLSDQYFELYDKAIQNYARDEGYKTCHTKGCEVFLKETTQDQSSSSSSSRSRPKGPPGVTCPLCQVTQCQDCGSDPHTSQSFANSHGTAAMLQSIVHYQMILRQQVHFAGRINSVTRMLAISHDRIRRRQAALDLSTRFWDSQSSSNNNGHMEDMMHAEQPSDGSGSDSLQ